MTISNSQLALQISELVDRWRTREAEYNTWLNGEAGGGDSGDGRYPLTDYDGVVHYAKSPAQLEAEVSGLVDSASSYADAAAASALAAASSAAAAETAASLAETHKATAATHAGLAAISAAEAANSASIAATNKSSSASSAAAAEGYAEDAAESATEAQAYSEAAAGSATDAASSASEAAESATAAAASATAAEAAQVAAESAEATVEAHSIAAQEARADAEEARDDAAAYASTAASAASSATASKTAAGNSAVAAASSASSAASSAAAASASASDASGYADDAAASALAAAASAAAAATFEPDNYLLKSGGTLSGDLGIRGGPSAAYLDIYTNHADYPVTKASLRISNANAGGQSVIDFVHSSTLKARIRSDYAGGLIFAAHDQIFFYTGGDHDTGWQRMVLQNNGTLYVDPGAAIRFGHLNQSDGNDGMLAAGRFAPGLNIVGTQTVGGSGRQVRFWGNTFWEEGAPRSDAYYARTDQNKVLYANEAFATYGSWVLSGARNGYTGLILADSPNIPTFMSNGGTCGVFFQGPGRWSWYDDGTYFNIVRQPRIPVGGALTYWVHNTFTSGAMTVSSSAPTPLGVGHIWFEV